MKLAHNYQNIINEVMNQQIEGWNSLSPLDPTKMIVSGLAGSLSGIEDRQKRLTDLMLSLGPTFSGIHCKGARGSTHLIQFRAPPDLLQFLPLNTPLKLVGESESQKFSFHFVEATGLAPIEILETKSTVETELGTQVRIKLKVLAPTQKFPLFFHAPSKSQYAGKLIEARIHSGTDQLNLKLSEIDDRTDSLRVSGNIFLSCDAQIPANDEICIELRWERPVHQVNGANFYANAFLAEVLELRENADLGRLQGDAWEELKLPSSLVDIPNRVFLTYPNGQQFEIHQASEELLRLSQIKSAAAREVFIYNSVRHSLVFPAAHKLVGDYMGGLALSCNGALFANVVPHNVSIDTLQLEAGLIECEKITEILPVQERESESALVTRYYSTLRALQVPSAQDTHRIDERRLKARLLNADSRLRWVELSFSKNPSLLYVYASTGRTNELLSPDLRAKLNQVLSEEMEIGLNWKLLNFVSHTLSFSLKIGRSSEAELNSDILRQQLQQILEALCPDQLLSGLSKNQILKGLFALKGVIAVEGSIQNLKTLAFLDEVERPAGTLIEVQLQYTEVLHA